MTEQFCLGIKLGKFFNISLFYLILFLKAANCFL